MSLAALEWEQAKAAMLLWEAGGQNAGAAEQRANIRGNIPPDWGRFMRDREDAILRRIENEFFNGTNHEEDQMEGMGGRVTRGMGSDFPAGQGPMMDPLAKEPSERPMTETENELSQWATDTTQRLESVNQRIVHLEAELAASRRLAAGLAASLKAADDEDIPF